MERLSRRKILGAAGAFAGGSALAGTAVAAGTGIAPITASAGAGDARVLALFQEWLEVTRAADRHSDDEDDTEYQALVDRTVEIKNEVMQTHGGPAALGIKCFFFLRADCLNNWTPDGTMVRCPELFGDEYPGFWVEAVVGIIRDAATQAPVLAELAAPIIHEDAALIDADMQIQWCRERLASGGPQPVGDDDFVRFILDNHARHIDETRLQLAKMLDRIAGTEAKTARGAAIKAKHAIRAEGLA